MTSRCGRRDGPILFLLLGTIIRSRERRLTHAYPQTPPHRNRYLVCLLTLTPQHPSAQRRHPRRQDRLVHALLVRCDRVRRRHEARCVRADRRPRRRALQLFIAQRKHAPGLLCCWVSRE
ncbi:hypothetical protein FA95DRAFT_1210202 [Auriscalpium vulgare]|uniref:Uncharacterized protein n=1 Tax=Auriscalpium vulgare TaxID=40419 RepID=A0ACB8RTT0_9AGAM|nr:hypothetical protein FA95DRAFT_1210202 [Auriscalpium vulgare]